MSHLAALVSGGVDSSVALALLLATGKRPRAYYLKVWLEDELASLGDCPWEEDLDYARAVCQRFGVELRVVPLQRAYRERIVEHTLAELRAGRTPSPDVLCNREIKLGAFLEELAEIEQVATGHYARRGDAAGIPRLLAAADPVKDQTYFLARLELDQLERTVFPLGALHKTEVRRHAAELGLATAARPDSQGLCFLGGIRWRDFVRAHLGEQPGAIVDESGRELGTHPGHWFLTLGQRHGLGLGNGPWFVVDKEPATNLVTVRHGSSPTPDPRRIRLAAPHWLERPPAPGESIEVKLRHGPQRIAATLDGDVLHLREGDRGVAPGQYAVFYREAVCLGCAVVAESG